jgi:RNA polymerase primary sigma factor
VELLTANQEVELAKPISLAKPVGDEEDSELGDFVADETGEEPYEAATEHLPRLDIQRASTRCPNASAR